MSLPNTLTNVSRFGTTMGVQQEDIIFQCHFSYDNYLHVQLCVSSSLHESTRVFF